MRLAVHLQTVLPFYSIETVQRYLSPTFKGHYPDFLGKLLSNIVLFSNQKRQEFSVKISITNDWIALTRLPFAPTNT